MTHFIIKAFQIENTSASNAAVTGRIPTVLTREGQQEAPPDDEEGFSPTVQFDSYIIRLCLFVCFSIFIDFNTGTPIVCFRFYI